MVNVILGKADVVLILPSTVNFCFTDSVSNSFMIKHIQVPLLPAFALTDYKVQGRFLKRIIVDLSCACSLQSVYVMLSRAVSLGHVLMLKWFPPHKVYQLLAQDLRDELKRLNVLAERTEHQYMLNHSNFQQSQ